MHRLRQRVVTKILSSETGNGVAYLLVLVSLAGISFLASPSPEFGDVDTVNWAERTTCRKAIASEETASETFTARVISSLEGQSLCRSLANRSALQSRYAHIEVRWEPASMSAERSVVERSPDLVLLRPNAQGITRDSLSDLYTEVAHYPSYSAYLIGTNKAPALEARHLHQRTIGLLSDEDSRSGYILPIRLFQRLNLPISELDIRYYQGHAELRRALRDGEVEIISSYWSDDDRAAFPDWQTTQIDEIAEGVNWYLANGPHEDMTVRCAVLSSLERLAANRQSGYFSELMLNEESYAGCHS